MTQILRRGLAVAAGMVVAGAVLAPLPAHAGTDVAAAASPLGKKPFSYSYSEGYCFYSKPLKKAMKVRVSGKLRYVRNAYKFNRGIRVRFHDPTLVEPKVTLATATKCSGGRAARVSKAKVEQLWYDWSCKTNVSVFVGLPWQAGVGATRSCGRTKRAHRSTDYGAGSGFVQHNSGAPAKWGWGGDGKGIKRGGKICLHGDGAATIWSGNRSDSVIRALDVCVPASYKGLS
ncbi:hypothetical protein ACSNOI_35285 [Actinomadura kijaniata]|uniref:hypothetical protein n=1 Tax=Actinomadura kijaniata TaxID=46161 RepID=UPI003F19FF84